MSVKRGEPPVVCIVGWSGVGKTTFLEKLIAELKRRGYRVAAIKHSSHPNVQVDTPGSDSWRYAKAGSDVSVLVTPRRLAIFEKLDRDLALSDVVQRLEDVDIILVEGYKHAVAPKIEVWRGELGGELISRPDEVVALVTDTPRETALPQLSLEDSSRVVDLLENRGILQRKATASGFV